MITLGIDIETRSRVSLKKTGRFPYTACPDFRILLLSYSLDSAPVRCVDLAQGEEMPDEFEEALYDKDVLKTAFNAPFEIAGLNAHYVDQMKVEEWECTMIRCAMLGYPMKLETVGKAMGLEHGKDKAGNALIKLFTVPGKDGRFNTPAMYPIHWKSFKAYNIRDVEVEQAIFKNLTFYKTPAKERKIWVLDQKINNVGILLDVPLIHKAIALNKQNVITLMGEAVGLTRIANPNSVPQLIAWLKEEMDEEVANLQKENVKSMLKTDISPAAIRMLEIRQELSKTSIKKYQAMLDCMGADNRARGLFQLCGAGKTWRWASRLIQVHNLTHTRLNPLDVARRWLGENRIEGLELMYGRISYVLSNLIRTMIIAPPGKQFLISDLSAIEARVLSWFAGEEWRLQVFRGDGKIYEASGARMFKIPIEQVIGDTRFKSKTAELALGFQGGVGAIIRMEDMGLKTGLLPEERKPLVDLWRSENRKIVAFWYAVEEAAITAVQNPGSTVKLPHLEFGVRHNTLFIKLPSGRHLSYVAPYMKPGMFGKECIGYMGIHQKTSQWAKLDTYGGKLVENIVQGTSRDILAEKMLMLDEAEFEQVLHVHDETVMEIWETDKIAFGVCDMIMAKDIDWAPGLPLAAKSLLSPYYLKD